MKKPGFLKQFQLISALLILSLIFHSCSEEFIVPEPEGVIEESSTLDIIEGQYVVLISEEPAVKNTRAASRLEELTKEVENTAGSRVNAKFRNVITGFAARLSPEQVKSYRKDPRILAVEQDVLISFDAVNTVQEYVTWGLDRIDQEETLLDRAYGFNATGKGITTYVVDSGIRFTHEEFEGRAVLGYDVAYDLYPEKIDPAYGPGVDCIGHGTHVAGTVGGKVYGVAKDVNLISVKLSSACEGTFPWSNVVAAVDWLTKDAVENGNFPAVVNMSIGGRVNEDSDILQTAIENSIQQGINYVVAAGNSNLDACEFMPAKFPGVLTVGATEIGDNRAGFSNFGECIDVYAPGVSIVSASVKDDTSTVAYRGTSMASPHVAGVVALFLEGNPEATPEEVHSAVIGNSTPNIVKNVPSGTTSLAKSIWKTFPFTPPIPPDLNFKVVGKKDKSRTTVQFTWDPTDDTSIIIYRNGTLIYEGSNNGRFTAEMGIRSNDVFKLCEKNYKNCSEELPVDYEGEILINLPPVADFNYEINDMNVTFSNLSSDPDGEIISYRWSFGDNNTSDAKDISYTYKEPGIYTVVLRVIDNYDSASYSSKEITVGEVVPPAGEIILEGTGYKVAGKWTTDLKWNSDVISGNVDIYRDGIYIGTGNNSGNFTDSTNLKGGGSLTYKICTAGNATHCSNEVIVNF